MRCKVLCCFAQKSFTWFLCYCSSIPFLTECYARTAATQLFTAVVTGKHVLIHITPTSLGVSSGKHMCIFVARASDLERFALQLPRAWVQVKHRCPVLTHFPLCKHVLAKHAVTVDQTQSSVQKGPTAALNYINYRPENTHSLRPLAPAIINDLFNKLKKMHSPSLLPYTQYTITLFPNWGHLFLATRSKLSF